jgi:hypothetical protein
MSPARTPWRRACGAASFEAQLARRVLTADYPHGQEAAITLHEHLDPATLQTALALSARHGTITSDAFDCVADAWETYRHLKDLSWD